MIGITVTFMPVFFFCLPHVLVLLVLLQIIIITIIIIIKCEYVLTANSVEIGMGEPLKFWLRRFVFTYINNFEEGINPFLLLLWVEQPGSITRLEGRQANLFHDYHLGHSLSKIDGTEIVGCECLLLEFMRPLINTSS